MRYSTYYIIKRILVQARPYWKHIIAIFILSLLATPIALLKPVALKILIDSGFDHHPLPEYIRVFFSSTFDFSFKAVAVLSAALFVIIALIENVYAVVIWILNIYTGEKLVLNFRTLLFNHIQRLSLAYHDRKGSSDSLYRIQYDTTAIRTLVIGNLSPLLSAFLTLIGMIVVMFLINWHLALIALSIIPLLYFLTRISTSRLESHWGKVKEDESLAMSIVHEVLNSIRVVKAFGKEKEEGERFITRADKAVRGQLKVAGIGAFFYFIVETLFAIGTALFIYLGAVYVNSGQMTLGELTLILAYLAQIFGPLDKISKNLNELQSSMTSINRVFSLLDKEKEVKESTNPVPLSRITGSLAFHQVTFSYEKENVILKDISFETKPGDRIGIMGSTGAGKTTLVSLLMRFYDPTSGKILVDGVDIRDYKLSHYRNQFGIVLQDPVLFSTTIRENIAYGCSNASYEEIIRASKLANAHEFIIRSKNGYDTLVGERGMQLSGGERQRVSLARAFIKNAPILILDEPTSSVDIKTEAQIMEAVERLMEGRTTFLITHRLDALKTCSLILHVEKGQLVDIIQSKDHDFFALKHVFLQSNNP